MKKLEKSDNLDTFTGVLDFYADWCGPCKVITPILDELSKENESVAFRKIDVDEHGDLAQEYKIRGIPSILFIKDGEIIETIVGVKSKADLAELLKRIK